MLAYKPAIDEESLVQGGLARRIEPLAPLESLLLKKPLLRVTHVGSKKLHPTDAAYDILLAWIGEGAKARPGKVAAVRGNRGLAPFLATPASAASYATIGRAG